MSVKRAQEFGLTSGQKLAGLLVFLSDVHAMGPPTAQGFLLTEAFYWDLNEKTRERSTRFAGLIGGMFPTMNQAGVYASMMHWMKAITTLDKQKAHSGADVVAEMKAIPTEDVLFGKGSIRQDGRTLHDVYLPEVKTASESKQPYDYYKLVSTIPAVPANATKRVSVGPQMAPSPGVSEWVEASAERGLLVFCY